MQAARLDAILDGAEHAQRLLPELSRRLPGATLNEVISFKRGALVALGTFEGTPAFFKHYIADDAARIVKRSLRELSTMAEILAGTRTFNVMRPLAAEPEIGLIVLERAPGQSVSTALEQADPDEKLRLTRLCGAWLTAATPRRKQGSFRAKGRMVNDSLPGLDRLEPEARAFCARLHRGLRQAAERHAETPVTRAIGHGDFIPDNLLVDGDTLTAIDIQAGHHLPLARMAARFLVAKNLFTPIGDCDALGLDVHDIKAFGLDDLLPEREVFALFVADEMLGAFLKFQHRLPNTDAARQRLTLVADALDQAGAP